MKNIILALALMLSACTVTHGSFTVMSNKIVDIKNFDLGKSERIMSNVSKLPILRRFAHY